MSIRTNPMRAVPVLLKRMKTAKSKFHQSGRDESLDTKLEKLTRELNKIEDVFMKVKKNQDELVDTLHEVDGHLRKLHRKRLDQDMDSICKRIRDCAHKLLPMESFEDEEDHERSEIVESSSSHYPSSTQPNNNHLLLPQPQHINFNLYGLTSDQRHFLEKLTVFPEGAVIKKRLAIYWWIGHCIVEIGEERTAEEMGEDVFDKLLKLNIFIPYGNGKSPIINKFQIHPHFRPLLEEEVERENAPHLGSYIESYWGWCLVLEQQNVVLDLDSLRRHFIAAVYNVSSSYLNFESQWLNKGDDIHVLQLGRWQNSPSHHIEVGNQDFLNNLSSQQYLKYLSLRGISRVFQLPPSITKVESLQILDLKACHNLETLPDDISSMKSLTSHSISVLLVGRHAKGD